MALQRCSHAPIFHSRPLSSRTKSTHLLHAPHPLFAVLETEPRVLYPTGKYSTSLATFPTPHLPPGSQGFTCSCGWPGNHYVDHADLKLAAILLPLLMLMTQACTATPSEPSCCSRSENTFRVWEQQEGGTSGRQRQRLSTAEPGLGQSRLHRKSLP